MKRMREAVLVLALFFAAGAAIQLSAAESSEVAEGKGSPAVEQITRKLGRGISNAVFGVLEVPIRIYEVQYDDGGIAALTWGTLSGVCYFIGREIVGVVEIVSFLFPLPGCRQDPHEYGWGYGPIMRPEWVMSPETNVYNIVYPSRKTMLEY